MMSAYNVRSAALDLVIVSRDSLYPTAYTLTPY